MQASVSFCWNECDVWNHDKSFILQWTMPLSTQVNCDTEMGTGCVLVVEYCLLLNNIIFGVWTKYLPHTHWSHPCSSTLKWAVSYVNRHTNTHTDTQMYAQGCGQVLGTSTVRAAKCCSLLASHTHTHTCRLLKEANKHTTLPPLWKPLQPANQILLIWRK